MKARPILMHARSIQNLLAGRKTQTRRIVKLPPVVAQRGKWEPSTVGGTGVTDSHGHVVPLMAAIYHTWTGQCIACPYGGLGDLLWVRETCALRDKAPDGLRYDKPFYRADVTDAYGLCFTTDDGPRYVEQVKWTPSIHMPRCASRLTLRLTDLRVERVQDISDEDCEAEGVKRPDTPPPYRDATGELVLPYTRTWHGAFGFLWDDTNGPGAWDRNDWVWALTFEVLHENVDAVLARAKVTA